MNLGPQHGKGLHCDCGRWRAWKDHRQQGWTPNPNPSPLLYTFGVNCHCCLQSLFRYLARTLSSRLCNCFHIERFHECHDLSDAKLKPLSISLSFQVPQHVPFSYLHQFCNCSTIITGSKNIRIKSFLLLPHSKIHLHISWNTFVHSISQFF